MFSFLRWYFKRLLVVAKHASATGHQKISQLLTKVNRVLKYQSAVLFHRIYRVKFRARVLINRHGGSAGALLLVALMAITWWLAPAAQPFLSNYFADPVRIESLRTFLITLGGSLIGAAAIVMSLVMFAMQINVERTPHRLFRRLSGDLRLLCAFALAFFLSFVIAGFGLALDPSWIAYATYAVLWVTVFILFVFLYAYRRALRLISPVDQLRIIADTASRHLRAWSRRADRAAPLFAAPNAHTDEQKDELRPSHDMPRVVYFRVNRHWTNDARDELSQAISFSRRYAEQGDYEVSAKALNVILQINGAYIAAKGKTFFGNQLLFDNPLTTDGFINHTLEHIRQNLRSGVSRSDEQQIEQNLTALADLTRLYLRIDYGVEHASKTHALISAGYLADAVRDVLPAAMPNVLMEGVRLMGASSQAFALHGRAEDAATLTDNIKLLSAVCLAKEDLRPVTLTGMEQIRDLTLILLQTKSAHVGYVAAQLSEAAIFVGTAICKLSDGQNFFRHNFYVALYFGATSTESLPAKLTELANRILDANENNEAAKDAIQNIVEWSDELEKGIRELLLLCVENRSELAFDLIQWIATVSKVLFALTKALGCHPRQRESLISNGLGIIGGLSWISRDRETTKFVENYQFTETLFRIAVDVRKYIGTDDSQDIYELLMSWTFDAGQHQIGWAVLERATYALVCLALTSDKEEAAVFLKHEYKQRLETSHVKQELREQTARAIRKMARSLGQRYSHSMIEDTLNRLDTKSVYSLLSELSDILSPRT